MLTFREVDVADAKLILSWRVKERITRFMNTDISYDLENQKRWVESCYHNPYYYHWIIVENDRPIGLINICNLDRDNKTTAWGFYIGEDACSGVGGFVPPYLYNFCFNQLDLRKISAEVFYNNTSVINLHQLHGYRFCPSKDRVIEKSGREILLIAMELNTEEFNFSKYKHFIAEFSLQSWSESP